MHTHHYAKDGEGTLHVFHTVQGKLEWLSDQRRHDRAATALTRRQAENMAGRKALRRMTRQQHGIHFAIRKE